MSRAKPIRLSDGRLVAPSRAKPLELREPLERAVRRCLVNGVPVVREGGRKFRLGWKPNCERPVAWLAYGARSEYVKGSRHPISVMGFGRCRKCEACLKARSQMWQIRAMYEYERWPVTLFGTVTLSPEEHYRHDAIIQQGTRGDDGRYIRHPANLDEMSPTEQFEARVGVFGDEMQRYFKRLRKGRKLAPGAIRYLLVAEAHDSERTDASIRGRPHFHLLIHECHPAVS